MLVVDEKTASASEILSAALKDNGRAKLAGHKTFGKAKVGALWLRLRVRDTVTVSVMVSVMDTDMGTGTGTGTCTGTGTYSVTITGTGTVTVKVAVTDMGTGTGTGTGTVMVAVTVAVLCGCDYGDGYELPFIFSCFFVCVMRCVALRSGAVRRGAFQQCQTPGTTCKYERGVTGVTRWNYAPGACRIILEMSFLGRKSEKPVAFVCHLSFALAFCLCLCLLPLPSAFLFVFCLCLLSLSLSFELTDTTTAEQPGVCCVYFFAPFLSVFTSGCHAPVLPACTCTCPSPRLQVQTLNQIYDGSGVAVTISLYKTPSVSEL